MLKKLLNISACVSACALVFGVVACSDDNSAGVTEDGNPIAYGESSSSIYDESSSSVVGSSSAIESSSAVQSSSSVEAVPKFDLWNGKTDNKINTYNENTGYWFSFSDDYYSRITWPVEMGNEYTADFLDPVFEYCEGVCGTVELHGSETMPWAGIGFTLAEENSTVDISAWGGICVTYASEYPVSVYLNVNVGGLDTIDYVYPGIAYPGITLPKTVTNTPTLMNMLGSDVAITRCAKWSDFKTSSWAEYNKAKLSKIYSGEEAAKEIKAINFVFMGNSDGSGEFNILGISTYDENLPQWNRDGGTNERDLGLVTTNDDSLTCLWKGLDGSGIVNTGYNDRGEFVGMLYDVDASPEGAYSKIEFPAYREMEYEPYMYEPIIVECKGFCGTMEFTLEKADYAASAVAFNIAEDTLTSCEGNTCYGEAKFADIKDWGGICITYYSEKDAYLNVVVKDVPYESSPKVSLPASGALVEKCFTWNDLAPNDPNMGSAVSVIQFIVKSYENGDRNQFNIAGIGKYSANGACSIPKTSYTPISSSSRTPRSSSSSKVYKDECSFKNLSPVWYGPDGYLGVKTGYSTVTSDGGHWYAFKDNDEVNETYPVQVNSELGQDSLQPVLNRCQGLCVIHKGAGNAGFGFNIADKDENGKLQAKSLKYWGGMCVVYASEYDLHIAINDAEQNDFANVSKLPGVTLPQTDGYAKIECKSWNEFVDSETRVPIDPSKISSILFYDYAKNNASSSFNILGIAPYQELDGTSYLKCQEPAIL